MDYIKPEDTRLGANCMGKKKIIYDSLVDRDKRAVDLVELIGVATREQIQRVVYPRISQNTPIRKLTMLTDNKLLKRDYYNLGGKNNSYVYYPIDSKKPSKRNIKHEIYISEFITNVMSISHVIGVYRSYKTGSIISDAYIKYKDSENRVRHLVLEVQLSGKVYEGCVEKYKKFKHEILEHRPEFKTIPRLVVITDLEHQEEQIKGMKVKYDSLQMNNLRELIF